MAVWAGSYLGLLPAAGILPSATRDYPERNAVMIGAHVVWGAALGYFTHRYLTHRLAEDDAESQLEASRERMKEAGEAKEETAW
jgi:hypothetical protein